VEHSDTPSVGDFCYPSIVSGTLKKAPMASLTIVGTVGLGSGMVTAVFTFSTPFLFRVDQVPGVHELFAVERPRSAQGTLSV
jgi:hypothetical protein